MRCVAVINQKGGVGKTTTAVNLGAALAERGQSVLLIDLDPQGHLSAHLGFDGRDDVPGTYELLSGAASLADAVRPVGPRLSAVTTDIGLAGAEVELAGTIGREVILRDLLGASTVACDWVLIDCPPSLGILTLNALCAVTDVLIPLQPHYLAMQGAGKLFETIALVGRRINPALRVTGLLMCMYESGTRLAAEVVEELERFLAESRGRDCPWRDARIFRTRIRRNIKLAESPSHGRTVFDYAPRSHGAEDYLALADEWLSVTCGTVPTEDGDATQGTGDGTSTRVGEAASAESVAVEGEREADHCGRAAPTDGLASPAGRS
ncbi:MAG: ParA family protein [Phycisphaerae bacterium]|nr:ParA family protein [Phycisphaerae bacterium]